MNMVTLIREGERLAPHHYALDESQWRLLASCSPSWFIGHWCDDVRVYALFLDQEKPLLVSTLLIDKRYFALSAALPAASWPERIAQDLWGVLPLDAQETAPAIDQGGWASISPFSSHSVASDHTPPSPAFLESLDGDMLPFSWAKGSITPGASHVGVLHDLRGKTPEEALHFLSRLSAASFIAAPLAYSHAIEQALGIRPSDEARDARTVLAEIERIMVHCRDIATMARLSGFALLDTHAALAEDLCATLCANHTHTRRLTDLITPEGIKTGIDCQALAQEIVVTLSPRLTILGELHLQMAECLEGLGVITPARAESCCIGGLVGRASGRSFDLRQLEDDMRHIPGRAGSRLTGDAWARQSLRLIEIRDSVKRLKCIAADFGAALPERPMSPTGSGEGLGAVEGPHGDIWCWVRLENARIDALYIRDPSLTLLPVLPSLFKDRWDDRLILASLGFDPGGMEQ